MKKIEAPALRAGVPPRVGLPDFWRLALFDFFEQIQNFTRGLQTLWAPLKGCRLGAAFGAGRLRGAERQSLRRQTLRGLDSDGEGTLRLGG